MRAVARSSYLETVLASRSFLICLAAGSLACTQERAAPAAASRASTAEKAGSPGVAVAVRGAVHLEGAIPALAPVPTSESVARACGAAIPDSSLQVGPGGALVDAVVSIDAPAEPSSPSGLPGPTVDQKACDYAPHVLAARAGATLSIVNSDPLVHSIHGAQSGRVLFNFAQPITGMRNQKVLPQTPGVVELRCEVHPWMHAYVKVFDQPYFAVTDAGGQFAIPNVPAGRHTLTVWQPRLGEHSVEVDVRPGMAPVIIGWKAGS